MTRLRSIWEARWPQVSTTIRRSASSPGGKVWNANGRTTFKRKGHTERQARYDLCQLRPLLICSGCLLEALAAVQKAAATTTNRPYILQSILPKKYNIPTIITPSHIPSTFAESSYMGLYTLIVSIIMLNGGRVSDEKLMRYLQRLNANVNTPVDKTELVLAKMQKQGYIVKIKDNASGTDITEWMVGPRGKVEVGGEGVKGLVETVYGDTAPDDLDVRLKASLGIKDTPGRRESKAVDGEREEPGRGGRRTRAADAEEE